MPSPAPVAGARPAPRPLPARPTRMSAPTPGRGSARERRQGRQRVRDPQGPRRLRAGAVETEVVRGGARATPTSRSPSTDSPRGGGAQAVLAVPVTPSTDSPGSGSAHQAASASVTALRTSPGAETRGGPGPGGHRSPPRQETRLEIPRLFRPGEKYSIPLLKNLFGRPLNKFRGAELLARGLDESRRQFFVKYRFFP